jgi:hypothetical protein
MAEAESHVDLALWTDETDPKIRQVVTTARVIRTSPDGTSNTFDIQGTVDILGYDGTRWMDFTYEGEQLPVEAALKQVGVDPASLKGK